MVTLSLPTGALDPQTAMTILIIDIICLIVLLYIIYSKFFNFEKRVAYLEGQIMILITQIKELDRMGKSNDEHDAYLNYLVSRVNCADGKGLMDYDEWLKGYNCGGYHD